MKGHCCEKCDWIFSREDAAEREITLRHGGPAIRLLCPECLSPNISEIAICPECQREECFEGEDLGRNCLAAEADALADVTLETIDERRPKSELSLLCADIAMLPWRKQA